MGGDAALTAGPIDVVSASSMVIIIFFEVESELLDIEDREFSPLRSNT
jgi:hypothetical protein